MQPKNWQSLFWFCSVRLFFLNFLQQHIVCSGEVLTGKCFKASIYKALMDLPRSSLLCSARDIRYKGFRPVDYLQFHSVAHPSIPVWSRQWGVSGLGRRDKRDGWYHDNAILITPIRQMAVDIIWGDIEFGIPEPGEFCLLHIKFHHLIPFTVPGEIILGYFRPEFFGLADWFAVNLKILL